MEVGADSDEEHVQERLRVVRRAVFPELFRAGRERVGGRVSGGDARRGRLDDRERRESLRPARRCQQGDHAAVRVPDEVVARLEQARDEHSVVREVHAFDRSIRRKSGPLDDDELEAVAERGLRAPGRRPAEDAAVYEDEALHEHHPNRVTSRVVFGSKNSNRLLQAR